MKAQTPESRLEVLSRLYDMKCKQLQSAARQGNRLRCQVLEAEAQAICAAMKTVR